MIQIDLGRNVGTAGNFDASYDLRKEPLKSSGFWLVWGVYAHPITASWLQPLEHP